MTNRRAATDSGIGPEGVPEPGTNPAEPAALNARAIATFADYVRTGQYELLGEVLILLRAALAATSENDPDQAKYLSNLGITLRALFERTGELDALVEAVDIARASVSAIPESRSERADRLHFLGTALRALFERTGDIAALVEAVDAGRAAVADTPENHRDLAIHLTSLGIALDTLFERTGDLAMLKESVDVRRAALAATPENHSDRAAVLNNLAIALRTLFGRTGELAALLESVEAVQTAAAATSEEHPGRAAILNNLGTALRVLFERTGDLDALRGSVEAGRAAVAATPEDLPAHADRVHNLATALRALSERTGDIAPLMEAVDAGRTVVAASSEDNPNHAGRLNNAAATLLALFGRTGDLGALREAVDIGRAAVAAAPDDHPGRAMYMSNLGAALQTLFNRTGELAVLAEAVEVGRTAVAATPEDHPDHAGRLTNLGFALRVLFGRTGEFATLMEAVDAGQAAVAAIPGDHPDRAMYLSNFGSALFTLFEQTEEPSALTLAVEVERAAVAATPEDHPGRAGHFNNLGNALRVLSGLTAEPAVLEEAADAGRAAVAATPEEHPDYAKLVSNLGNTLREQFEQTRDRTVLDEARSCYRQAASSATGATISRINSYRQLAQLDIEAGDPQDGLRCLEAAIDLVDVLAPGSLVRPDREHQLGRVVDLAGEAAAAALSAGRPARAVELLERTRGILAADTLGIRGGDLARLREQRPALAGRLEQLRTRLDALDQPRLAPLPGTGAPITATATARQVSGNDRLLSDQRREAHAAWQSLLEEIHSVPGFADFLRTPSISTLAHHARYGPIVYVTTSPTRADALILTDTPDPVHVVPLPGLTHESAHEQVDQLLASRRSVDVRDAEAVGQQTDRRGILPVLEWLWDTIAEPVLTRLGHTETPFGDTPWPRIWWCPVGILSFLPLHAAGRHDPEPDWPARVYSVPDLVVSSYIPTVRALAQARAPRPAPATGPTTLVVPVPDTPGAELPGVTAETIAIAALIPDALVLRRPTRDGVLAALPTRRIVHFSCHGEADWDQPARSRLILTDASLTLADITPLDLDADLAYLSACDTAVTAPRLADESLHITGAFHLAGYRHVIGTLWPINDRTAALIAEDFYTYLTTDGIPHPDCAAYALHHATTRLRTRYPDTPFLWAAHTHTGA